MYSREVLQKTIEYWGPKYAERGETLTEEGAREILSNLGGFFKTLAEWDAKEKTTPARQVDPKLDPAVIISPNEKKLVNVEELAKILDVPVSWIYQRTMQGPKAIPHVKMGKYVRFNPDEVIAFFKN